MKEGGVFARAGIITLLLFLEFLVVLRTLEFFFGFDDVMIFLMYEKGF